MNNNELNLILSYILVYKELLEAEEDWKEIKTFHTRLKYIKAHEEYEKALGFLMKNSTPIEVLENIKKIINIMKKAGTDIQELFNL